METWSLSWHHGAFCTVPQEPVWVSICCHRATTQLFIGFHGISLVPTFGSCGVPKALQPPPSTTYR